MTNSILIIDDEPHFLEAHRLALEEVGYTVEIIENARDAAERLRHGAIPSLIILDIIMPFSPEDVGPENGTNMGISLLEILRDELKIAVPIIILTVVANQETHERISQIEERFGYEPVIYIKPFLPSELLDEVRRLIGNP